MEKEAGLCILQLLLYFEEKEFHNGGHMTHTLTHTQLTGAYISKNPETVFARLLIRLLPPCEGKDMYVESHV